MVCAAFALVASFALFSCSQGTSYSGATDTVNTLDGVSNLTATAYPGMNYITWDTEKDAASYEVWCGDTELGTVTSGGSCFWADKASSYRSLVDGQSYTYKVVSVSSSNASRAVYYQNGEATTSCTAIVPAVGTGALALAESESDYDSEAEVLSADTITPTKVDGNVIVSFPTKAYITYSVYVTDADEVAANGGYDTLVADGMVNYNTDATGYASVAIYDAGEKTVSVVADPVSSFYTKTTVVATTTVTVDSLDVTTATANLSASYLDSSTARVLWTPAVLSDGTTAPVDDYKVYRYADYAYTEVTGIAETTQSGDTYYYVDDSALTNTISNKYYVALTDGTSYGASKSVTLSAYSGTTCDAASISVTASAMDADNLANDVKVVVSSVPQDETLVLSYADCGTSSSTTSLVESDYTTVTLPTPTAPTSGYYTYTVWIKDLTGGDYYAFRAATSKTGYESAFTTSTKQISTSTVSFSGSIDAYTYYTSTLSTAEDNNVIIIVDDTISDTETLSNYTYTLYRATYDTTYSEVGDYALVGEITMAESGSSTSYEGTFTQTTVDDGTYVYMIEKYDSASETAVTDTTYVTVDTSASIGMYISACTRDDTTAGTVEVTYTTANASGYTFTLYCAEYDVNGSYLITNYSEATATSTDTTSGDYTIKTYDVSDLVSGHKYAFYVKAVNGTEKSYDSATMASD